MDGSPVNRQRSTGNDLRFLQNIIQIIQIAVIQSQFSAKSNGLVLFKFVLEFVLQFDVHNRFRTRHAAEKAGAERIGGQDDNAFFARLFDGNDVARNPDFFPRESLHTRAKNGVGDVSIDFFRVAFFKIYFRQMRPGQFDVAVRIYGVFDGIGRRGFDGV